VKKVWARASGIWKSCLLQTAGREWPLKEGYRSAVRGDITPEPPSLERSQHLPSASERMQRGPCGRCQQYERGGRGLLLLKFRYPQNKTMRACRLGNERVTRKSVVALGSFFAQRERERLLHLPSECEIKHETGCHRSSSEQLFSSTENEKQVVCENWP